MYNVLGDYRETKQGITFFEFIDNQTRYSVF